MQNLVSRAGDKLGCVRTDGTHSNLQEEEEEMKNSFEDIILIIMEPFNT